MDFFSSKPQIKVQEIPNQNENNQPLFAQPMRLGLQQQQQQQHEHDNWKAAAAAAEAAGVGAEAGVATVGAATVAAATAATATAATALLTPALNLSFSQRLLEPRKPLESQLPLPPLSIPSGASTASTAIPPIPITTFTTIPRPRRPQHIPAPDAAQYNELSVSQLPPLLEQDRDSTLVVDIRPYAQFCSSRIPNSVSLSVPSILLKRSSTDWNKITAGITDPAALERFSHWKSAATLLILDTDTTVLAESNSLLAFLRRFRIAGYSGNLSWVTGGMTAIHKDARSIVVFEHDSPSTVTTATTATTTTTNPPLLLHGCLCPRDLPIQAFQGTSTTMLGQSNSTPSRETSSFTAANPFYDNIRQNVELADGVGDKIPLLVPDYIFSRRDDLPSQWLRDLLIHAETPDHGAEMLALQFYRIEVGEQRRLQGIMSHHSRQHHDTRPIGPPLTAPVQFPFSITAGIEMGTKNRYRNIWPFEHARVRLRTISATDGSDYVNASYVQPMVTKRRYIATQGPLATTFNDFWTIVWEQNVPVIVMLTREVEGNHVKSDCYWKDGQYGDLQLKLDEQVGATDVASLSRNCEEFNFGSSTVMHAASEAIIKRVFTLHNTQQPSASPRKIVHLQYLGWPDLNVPESSRGILDLIGHVNGALPNGSPMEEAEHGPVMLHCSAGVGRTGGFILVDSILDGIRRELRNSGQRLSSGSKFDLGASSDAMDLDEPEIPPSPVGQHEGSLDVTSTHRTTPSASTVSLHLGAPDSMHKSLKPSINDAGASDKQQGLSHTFAEKLVNVSAASDPPLSNAATISAWSASLPPPHSEYGNRTRNGSEKGSAKGSDSIPPSDSPPPPDLHGDENDIYFKVPRKLHQTNSLPWLSTLSEPIREVLEDMREQRMSLCQSLRQYVFAHRVILEGALEIVDEEKELLRQQRLENVDGLKRAVEPWDVQQPQPGARRQKERGSSSLLRSGSQPLNFWSSTSSFSSLPDDSGSSVAASSSAARPPDPNFTSPFLASFALPRTMQAHREATPPSSAMNSLPVLTSPMRDLSIDPSSSRGSRQLVGRLSQERPRTPGSVAFGLPPPVLTGKRSHSPSRWERKTGHERNVQGHGQDHDVAPAAGRQRRLAERPSVKRKLRSDDTVDASTGPRGKLGAGAGMIVLNQ